MDLGYLAQGVAIGLAVAAPLGPIGMLCIRRTLDGGRLAGLVSGLGVATADAMYGAVAGFGLTVISNFLISQQTWLRLVGGVFLCYLGIKTVIFRPAERAAIAAGGALPKAYVSTLLLTLSNPTTIISFAAIFAGLGVASGGGEFGPAASMVVGVFLGSALWWLILSTAVGLLRARFNPRALRIFNIVSGLVIAGFGLAALVSLLG